MCLLVCRCYFMFIVAQQYLQTYVDIYTSVAYMRHSLNRRAENTATRRFVDRRVAGAAQRS